MITNKFSTISNEYIPSVTSCFLVKAQLMDGRIRYTWLMHDKKCGFQREVEQYNSNYAYTCMQEESTTPTGLFACNKILHLDRSSPSYIPLREGSTTYVHLQKSFRTCTAIIDQLSLKISVRFCAVGAGVTRAEQPQHCHQRCSGSQRHLGTRVYRLQLINFGESTMVINTAKP